VQLVDEKDDVPRAPDLIHHGLDPLLELTAVLRPGDHEREVEGDDLLLGENLGHVTRGDLLGQTLDDRGLAHAGLADEHRVVLGAPAKDLDDPPDLVLAAHDRVHLALAGQFRQIAPEGLEGGCLDLLLVLGLRAGTLRRTGRSLLALSSAGAAGELRIKFAEDLVARALDVDLEGLEHTRGDPLAFAEQA